MWQTGQEEITLLKKCTLTNTSKNTWWWWYYYDDNNNNNNVLNVNDESKYIICKQHIDITEACQYKGSEMLCIITYIFQSRTNKKGIQWSIFNLLCAHFILTSCNIYFNIILTNTTNAVNTFMALWRICVSIVTRLRDGRLGVRISAQASDFSLHQTLRPLIAPTSQYIIKLEPWTSFVGVNRAGRDVDHSPPPGADVKNKWSHTSAPPYTVLPCTGQF